MSESRTLAREGEVWGGNGGLLSEGRQVPRRRSMASKKSLPWRRRMTKHERVSGLKGFSMLLILER